MKKIFCLVLVFGLFGCGVKAPPIAPERPVENSGKMNCSPYERDCDNTDSNYAPGKR